MFFSCWFYLESSMANDDDHKKRDFACKCTEHRCERINQSLIISDMTPVSGVDGDLCSVCDIRTLALERVCVCVWVYTSIFAQCYPACARPTEVRRLSTVEVHKNVLLTKREQTLWFTQDFPTNTSGEDPEWMRGTEEPLALLSADPGSDAPFTAGRRWATNVAVVTDSRTVLSWDHKIKHRWQLKVIIHHVWLGLQRGGKYPVNFRKLSKNPGKFPKIPVNFQKSR